MDEREREGSSPNRKQATLKDTKHRVPNTRHYIQALFLAREREIEYMHIYDPGRPFIPYQAASCAL